MNLDPVASDTGDIRVPEELPFLESLSWFDLRWRELGGLDMLRRYERGWRHRGITGDLSPAERAFVHALARKYGSELDVPP
jgi:hypothetical protein